MTQFPKSGLFQRLEGGAFASQNATLTGDVSLGQDVGVWFGCVLRGDDAPLIVGGRSNVQDLTMIHADTGVENRIGEEVTIGHGCVLHGAEIADRCLIGMGVVLLGGSKIGEESIIGAGSVVTEVISFHVYEVPIKKTELPRMVRSFCKTSPKSTARSGLGPPPT